MRRSHETDTVAPFFTADTLDRATPESFTISLTLKSESWIDWVARSESSALYFIKPTSPYPHYSYKGFEFYQYGGLWNTQWQRGTSVYDVHIRYGPREAESIRILTGENSTFNPNGKLYITHDPKEFGLGYVALASAELSLTLSQAFNVTPIGACTFTMSQCAGSPIVTCDNADGAVIYLKEVEQPDQTAVILNGNCMTIQGNKEELMRAADKVIWIWYGIIK